MNDCPTGYDTQAVVVEATGTRGIITTVTRHISRQETGAKKTHLLFG